MKKNSNAFSNLSFILFRYREIPLLLVIIIIFIVAIIRRPYFLSFRNLNDIIAAIAVYSIIAIGQMIVIITGGIDLSVGTGLGFSAMLTGLIIVFFNIHFLVAILIGALVGGLLGAFNGLLITKGKIFPLVTTLATLNIFRGANVVLNHYYLNGKWIAADQLPRAFTNFTRGNILGIPNLLIIMIILYLGFYYLLNHTTTGREFYALGSNKNAAEMSGINIRKVGLLAYTISGILFGFAGIVYASRFSTIQTTTGTGFEFIVITAVILGGVSLSGGAGSITGVLLGVFLMGILTNALMIIRIPEWWRLTINGFLLLFAVVISRIVENRIHKRQIESRRIL